MKRFTLCIAAVLLCLACNKEDSEYTDVPMYSPVPRSADYIRVIAGNFDETSSAPGLITKNAHSVNETEAKKFALSIQTGNTPFSTDFSEAEFLSPDDLNITEGTTEEIKQYMSAPITEYEAFLGTFKMKRRISGSDMKDNALIPSYPYEYRTDGIEEFKITSDIQLFGQKSGTDLSQYFKIVLFYANLKGHPAYIMSHTSRQISKIAEPPSINIFETEDVALSDDYKSYIDNELTLAEWVSLKPYADPALYIKFTEIPPEVPCNALFTVTIKTSDGKILNATCNKVRLL